MAGDKGQDLVAGRVQDGDILGAHNLAEHHAVAVLDPMRGQDDDIVYANLFQGAKKRIAVPGNAYVSVVPRQCGAGNMTGGPTQSLTAYPFSNDYGKTDTRNFDAAEETAVRGHY
jgi:stringent starvation protein B